MRIDTQERRQAHELLETAPEEKLPAVVHLLRAISDPVARSIANAPIEDEPSSEEEIRAAEASREWLKHHEPISHEKVLAELGITPEDFERRAARLSTIPAKAAKGGKEGRLDRSGKVRPSPRSTM